jgi:hypothetical protein
MNPMQTTLKLLAFEAAESTTLRVELSCARLLGGFAISLASALIAHLLVGDGPRAWGWAAATSVLWGVFFFFWRRRQSTQEGDR